MNLELNTLIIYEHNTTLFDHSNEATNREQMKIPTIKNMDEENWIQPKAEDVELNDHGALMRWQLDNTINISINQKSMNLKEIFYNTTNNSQSKWILINT
jgi:hypothetical protein